MFNVFIARATSSIDNSVYRQICNYFRTNKQYKNIDVVDFDEKVDENPKENAILHIENADLVIAMFTPYEEQYSLVFNHNVCLELGIATGLRKDIQIYVDKRTELIYCDFVNKKFSLYKGITYKTYVNHLDITKFIIDKYYKNLEELSKYLNCNVKNNYSY